jgi:hypothetical protein
MFTVRDLDNRRHSLGLYTAQIRFGGGDKSIEFLENSHKMVFKIFCILVTSNYWTIFFMLMNNHQKFIRFLYQIFGDTVESQDAIHRIPFFC